MKACRWEVKGCSSVTSYVKRSHFVKVEDPFQDFVHYIFMIA